MKTEPLENTNEANDTNFWRWKQNH